MTNNEFKVGDRVCRKSDKSFTGTIRGLGAKCAEVVWDSDSSGEWYLLSYAEIEHIDRRTAFLTELQALLRKYDAELGDSGITRIMGMEITFGDNTPRVRYKHCTLNADNIMDFNKE